MSVKEEEGKKRREVEEGRKKGRKGGKVEVEEYEAVRKEPFPPFYLCSQLRRCDRWWAEAEAEGSESDRGCKRLLQYEEGCN